MLCHKIFPAEEVNYNSTRRELITILYSLQAFGSKLHNCSVKCYTDSQATAKIVEVGCMKTVLQQIAYHIFSHCLENNIDLRIEWIPREFNRQADFISRIRDCYGWQVTQEFFLELNVTQTLTLTLIQSIVFQILIKAKFRSFIPDIGTPGVLVLTRYISRGPMKTVG